MADEQVERLLPPIEQVVAPQTLTKSAKIRWYFELGYPVKEIAKHMAIRYQQVRNIVTNKPKRAAREDLPPLEFEVKETQDLLEAAMDGALEASLLAGRKARKKDEANQRRADREFRSEEDEEVTD